MDNFTKQLESRGYRKYAQTNAFPYSEFFYQKRFDDKVGKKYFIEFVFYKYEENYSVMMNWNNNNPHYTFQAHRVIFQDIEYFENTVDFMWGMLKCDYYEKFGE